MPDEPDALFGHARLATVYDALDPVRDDLDAYEAVVVDDLNASSVLDVGCGTGVFALRLARRGLSVTGLDPAEASVDVARGKPGSEKVSWIVGAVSMLPRMTVDAVTMTANVAQVFITDAEWEAVLAAAWQALRPGGLLIFEARRPEDRAWERWTTDATVHRAELPGGGSVERWVEVTDVDGDRVTFSSPTIFHSDGVRIDSMTTLRFRGRAETQESLTQAGFEVEVVRDLPYAPGRGWLYLARRG